MKRKYWEAREGQGLSLANTPHHEAMHGAAIILVGGMCEKMVIRADGSGYSDIHHGREWQQLVSWLAPALTDDLSPGDSEFLRTRNPRVRGYAWAWLRKNRDAVLALASELTTLMIDPPGTLYANTEGEWVWKSSRRKK